MNSFLSVHMRRNLSTEEFTKIFMVSLTLPFVWDFRNVAIKKHSNIIQQCILETRGRGSVRKKTVLNALPWAPPQSECS